MIDAVFRFFCRRFHPLHQPSPRRYFALCRVFRWCLLAQRALRSSMVVIRTPPCAKQLRLRECRENLSRQQLVPQSGVETFNDSVLPRRQARCTTCWFRFPCTLRSCASIACEESQIPQIQFFAFS